MSFARLIRFYRLPPSERIERLKRRLRVRRVVSQAAFGVFFIACRCLVNRRGSSLVLVARPEFDFDHGNFPEYRKFHAQWTRAMRRNRSDLARLYVIYLNVTQILKERVPGDFAEVGVYKGNSAKILAEMKNGRRLFLFDTFSGFDSNDFIDIEAGVLPDAFADTSLERVREFIGTDRVVYVKGRFPESAGAGNLPEMVALLHLDCDLYEPMKSSLELFYPRMAPGGIILMHDYASGHWPGASKAIDEFFADKPESVIVMPDRSGTATVRICCPAVRM